MPETGDKEAAVSRQGHQADVKGVRMGRRSRGSVTSGEGAGGIVEGSVKMPLVLMILTRPVKLGRMVMRQEVVVRVRRW